MSSLKNEALSACESSLKGIGFVKRGGALIQDRGNGVYGWIGLNIATHGLPDLLKVSPVVGVRFERFAEIASELRDDIPKKPIPVISKPLGYLMPGKSFRSWEFLRDSDHDRVAASLAEAVRDHGEPYIEKYSDWGEFSRDIGSPGLLMEHERAKTLPIVHVINGQVDEAAEMVRAELARVADVDDMYARSYRDFAERFFAKFGTA